MSYAAHFLNELNVGLLDGNTHSLEPMDESPEHDELGEDIIDVYMDLETVTRVVKDINIDVRRVWSICGSSELGAAVIIATIEP